jgi:hypothetical protein
MTIVKFKCAVAFSAVVAAPLRVLFVDDDSFFRNLSAHHSVGSSEV